MKRFFKTVTLLSIGVFSSFASFAETIHIVKKGETLYSISRSYGISVKEIQDANGLADNNVKIDQKLSIPDAKVAASDSKKAESADVKTVAEQKTTTHIVQQGETLYSISRTHGVSVSDIQEWNSLSGNTVWVGQKLSVVPPEKSEKVVKAESSEKTEKTEKKVEVVSKPSVNLTPTASQPPASSSSSKQNDVYYIVQKGDTWLGIALDYGLTLSEIQALNNVTDADMIKIGQKVKVSKVPDLKDNDPRVYVKKGDASLVWPVKASDVTYIDGKVNGVSLAAKKNETVRAISSGTVVVAGSYRGYGNVVFVQGKSGHIYAYTGLGNVHVSKGDTVSYGGDVGTAGIDAYTDSPQVNLMVFQNSKPIDPAKAPRG